MLDVGTEMIMKHEQHLSSSYNSSSSGFGFLEGICLTGEVTSNDVRECRKQLCIKSRKRRNLPERFKSLIFFPRITNPFESAVGIGDAATTASLVLILQLR